MLLLAFLSFTSPIPYFFPSLFLPFLFSSPSSLLLSLPFLYLRSPQLHPFPSPCILLLFLSSPFPSSFLPLLSLPSSKLLSLLCYFSCSSTLPLFSLSLLFPSSPLLSLNSFPFASSSSLHLFPLLSFIFFAFPLPNFLIFAFSFSCTPSLRLFTPLYIGAFVPLFHLPSFLPIQFSTSVILLLVLFLYLRLLFLFMYSCFPLLYLPLG